MAISPNCPETGLPCRGREFLIEMQVAQDLATLDGEVYAYTDSPMANKVFRIWDVIGGHTARDKKALKHAQEAIVEAAQMHEVLSNIPERRVCEPELCGTMAQLIIDQVVRLRP